MAIAQRWTGHPLCTLVVVPNVSGMRISVLLVRPDGTAMPLGSRPTDDRRLHTLANVCRATSLVRGHRARVQAGDRLRVQLDAR